MPRYACTGCGGDQTEIAQAHPSLDDRYLVGYCARCSPVPKDPMARRRTVVLVPEDRWDPETLAGQAQARTDRRLLRKFGDPKPKDRPLTEAERDRVTELLADYAQRAEGG